MAVDRRRELEQPDAWPTVAKAVEAAERNGWREQSQSQRGGGHAMNWVVCGMNDGLRRDLPTRRAAVEWAKAIMGPDVLQRVKYGQGDHECILGHRGEDTTGSAFILREENMYGPTAGWDPTQQPLYALSGDPYEQVERTQA